MIDVFFVSWCIKGRTKSIPAPLNCRPCSRITAICAWNVINCNVDECVHTMPAEFFSEILMLHPYRACVQTHQHHTLIVRAFSSCIVSAQFAILFVWPLRQSLREKKRGGEDSRRIPFCCMYRTNTMQWCKNHSQHKSRYQRRKVNFYHIMIYALFRTVCLSDK